MILSTTSPQAKSRQSGFILTKNERNQVVINNKPKLHKSNYSEQIKNAIADVLNFPTLNNIEWQASGRKINANESSFLRDQLTAMVGNVLNTWYQDNTARMIFPFRSLSLPGVQSLRYDIKSWSGKAKIVDNEATDMPYVGLSKDPTYQAVYELQLGARYTLAELEAAAFGMEPLSSDYLNATREGSERAINDIAFGIGDTDDPLTANIPGAFNQPTKFILAADNSDLTNDNMLTNTPTENRDFLVGVINAPYAYTKNAMSIPDTLVMPIAQANKINTQALSADNNNTVAKWILDNTSIERIVASPECLAVGKNSITDALMCFKSDPQIMEFQETLAYRPYPAQLDGFTYKIPTRTRVAGLFIYREKAAALVKNCGA